MSNSPGYDEIIVKSSDLCDSPEELLRSRRFAEFLSSFNRSERVPRQKEIVIPDQVANNPVLAKEVFIYYLQNKTWASGDSACLKWIDDLAERTYVEIKNRHDDRLMELGRFGRKGVKGIFESENEEGYDVDTPDWIVALAPDCQKTVPLRAQRELEKAFQQWYAFCAERAQGETLAKRVLASVMNNFYTLFAHRRNRILTVLKDEMGKKIGAMCKDCGPKMVEKTWRQFYAEIDRVLRKHGRSAKALRGMDQTQASLYLLPVFLELLSRGYKVYPDLTR